MSGRAVWGHGADREAGSESCEGAEPTARARPAAARFVPGALGPGVPRGRSPASADFTSVGASLPQSRGLRAGAELAGLQFWETTSASVDSSE